MRLKKHDNANINSSSIENLLDMDSAAYLIKHGWLGTGHSLHPKGHGIRKPLLISEKLDLLGVGKKKHDIHADQWWARMFDSTLKELQIGTHRTSANPKVLLATSSRKHRDDLHHRQPNSAGTGSLYGNFVKGESLVGTIEAQAAKHTQTVKNTDLQLVRNNDGKARPGMRHNIEVLQAEEESKSSLSPDYKEHNEARQLQRLKRKKNPTSNQSRRKARKKVQDGGNKS